MSEKKTRKQWTAVEDQKLLLLIGTIQNDTLAKQFGVPVSAMVSRSRQLGIKSPELRRGYLNVNQAASQYDINWKVIKRAFSWHHMTPVRIGLYGAPARYYDADDVEEAVEAWRNRESLQKASVRVGWCAPTLLDWLTAAGCKVRRTSKKQKSRIYVDRAEVDRVVTERMEAKSAVESMSTAAIRHGVCLPTMSRWLKEAGVVTGRARSSYRNLPEVHDRVVQERQALCDGKESILSGARRHGMSEATLRKNLRKAGYSAPNGRKSAMIEIKIVDEVAEAWKARRIEMTSSTVKEAA